MFEIPTLPSITKQYRRVWIMLVLSIAIHIGVLVLMPKWEVETKPVPPPLVVELEKTKPLPPPAPVVQPEPLKPIEPPKPKQLPKPALPKPIPVQQSVVQDLPQVKQVEPAPPPVVIAVDPQPSVKVETVVAAPPVIKDPPAPVVSQEDLDAARGRYVGALQRAIAKHKSYPSIARTRGWQGEAMVDIHLDANGGVLGSEISVSSGYDVLDKQALEMMKKASPFPAPPEVLQGRSFHLTVPVAFRLE